MTRNSFLKYSTAGSLHLGGYLQTILLMWYYLFMIMLPFQVSDNNIIQPLINAPFFFLMKMVLPLLITSVVFFFSEKNRLKVKWLDIVVLLFVVYVAINNFLRFGEIMSVENIELISFYLLYISIRLQPTKSYRYLLIAFVISVLCQAILGQLQLYGIKPSHHSLFNITGSFFNPAPYAGYLIAAVPVALYIYLRYGDKAAPRNIWRNLENKTIYYLALCCLVAVIIVLPATQSRSAWMGFIVISGLILYYHSEYTDKFKQWLKDNTRKGRLIKLSSILLVVLALVAVYYLKKDSANGRLLIWQIGVEMLKDKPLWGWGHNGFETHYMEYQASFFQAFPKHTANVLADNVQYVYNELLKLGIEYGFIGFILALVVLYITFKTKGTYWELNAARYGILALLIFSMFSYPSEIIAIKVVFIMFLAIVASGSKCIVSLDKGQSITAILLLMLFAAMLTPKVYNKVNDYYDALSYWRDASDIYRVEAYEECLEDFELAYPELYRDGNFLVQYGKALAMAEQEEKAIRLLEEAKTYLNNTILYTALGDCYTRKNLYKEAEDAYYTAYYMVPNRFYPLYLLAKMYYATEQYDKAKDMANSVLKKDVKVHSRAIEEIHEEIKELLMKMEEKK